MAVRELSPGQLALAGLVAGGECPSRAAAQVGVAPRTARRWATSPAFLAEVDRLQADMSATVQRRLRALGERACAALGGVLDDAQAAPSARVSAAKAVLDGIQRYDELNKLELIERRLTRLEENLGPTQI